MTGIIIPPEGSIDILVITEDTANGTKETINREPGVHLMPKSHHRGD